MRRQFQFSLRALLVVFTAVCVWTGAYVQRARRQCDAVAALRNRAGILIEYDYERASRQTGGVTANQPFGAHVLGIDMVANVSDVMVMPWQRRSGVPFGDVDLAQISAFPKRKHLRLDGTNVTDRGLASLVGLRHLNFLYLRDSPRAITDAAFSMLAKAPDLEFLDLRETPVTDSGLRQLARSPSLKELHVSSRHVTAAGRAAFGQSNSACRLKLRPSSAAASTIN